MSDNNPDLVFQEVDEEVRRERMTALWKAYGKYLVGAAVGIVLVVAGREGYGAYVKSVEEGQAAAYAQALEAASAEGADVTAIWNAAMPDLGEGYQALATLQMAAALSNAGDIDGALAAYGELGANASADPILKSLAELNAAMLIAGELKELDEAKSKFATLAVKGRPWYFSALEQIAIIDMQQGNEAEALQNFIILADDLETPQSIRARASQFRALLESKAEAATLNSSPASEEAPTEEAPAEEAPAEEGSPNE